MPVRGCGTVWRVCEAHAILPANGVVDDASMMGAEYGAWPRPVLTGRETGRNGVFSSMAATDLDALVRQGYKHGFFTDIETDTVPPGLNEDIIRFISAKKNEPEFLLQWRLRAYRPWRSSRGLRGGL